MLTAIFIIDEDELAIEPIEVYDLTDEDLDEEYTLWAHTREEAERLLTEYILEAEGETKRLSKRRASMACRKNVENSPGDYRGKYEDSPNFMGI